MTTKKFKRVIPGQLENLKKLLDSCVIEKVYSVHGFFIKNKHCVDTGCGGNFFTFIVINVGDMEIKFIFQRVDATRYEVLEFFVKSKTNKNARVMFDSVVPFYEKITYAENMVNHIDCDSISCIEEFFKERINFSYETICSYVEWSYGLYDGPGELLDINSSVYTFSEAEKQAIVGLSDVKNVIES